MMGGYDGAGWPFFHGFGWLFIVLSGIVIAAAILAMLRALGRQQRAGDGGGPGDAEPDRALAILRERYARGELTKEQFEQMRRELG
jgi:putative membrane protein